MSQLVHLSHRVALAMALWMACPVLAVERFVPSQYASISSAVSASTSGDIITVAPGTYTDVVTYAGKNVTIRSSGGASATTVRPTAGARAFRMVSAETSAAVLDGFTITRIPGQEGAAIELSSSARVRNCIIVDCGGPDGPGVLVSGGAPRIETCRFERNAGSNRSTYAQLYGGSAVTVSAGDPTIASCIFDRNTGQGSAVMVWPSSARPVVEDCVLLTASGGYSNQFFYNYGALLTVRRAVFGPQVLGWNLIFGWRDILVEDTVFDTDLDGQGSATILGNSAGTITVDRCRFESSRVAAQIHSHAPYGARSVVSGCVFCPLRPAADCCMVDAGNNRFNGPCPSPTCFGDLDQSGRVDLGDIAIILLSFGSCSGCAGDIDDNGIVDPADFALVLLSFGSCG